MSLKRWESNQFDRLAAGSLAGHLIECGAQVAQSPLDDNQHLLRADQSLLPQVLHRLQNKEKPIRTTFTLRFGSLKMIFECSIARCDVGLGRAIVQCQKNPLRKPKLSINRAILSAHFSAVKFCIGFFCWIGFFWFCIGFFCNWMLQLLLKIVATNLNYASLHVCT